MRFLHIADLHLGFALNGVSFAEEQAHALSQVRTIIREQNIDGILIAGDVFDRAVTNAETLALYDRFLTALRTEDGVAVFMIAGNHDGGARLAQLSAILAASGIHISGTLSCKPQPTLFGDTEVWLIPYFHTDQVRLLYPDVRIQSADDAMRTLIQDINARKAPDKKSVVVAHCFVNGAHLSDSDIGARIGGASMIGADVFEGISYTALGHLHRMQHPAGRVWYSGSLYPYSFSESEKYVLIYDSITDTVSPIPLYPLRALRTITGTYEEAVRIAEHDANRDDYMRVILTDRSAGMETLEQFRTFYPRLLMLLSVTETAGSTSSLTNEELSSIAPQDLLIRFCTETADYEPDQAEIESFLEALRYVQGEGGLQ